LDELMEMDQQSAKFWRQIRFDLFIVFCWLALAGLFFAVVAFTAGERSIAIGAIIAAVLLFLPFLVHGTLLALWHWKSRYRGKHSMLWGALLVLEASGWFKLIYLIRHVLADHQKKGRYAVMSETEAASSR
jgi:hypothetical protein